MPQPRRLSATELTQLYEADMQEGASDNYLRTHYGREPHWFLNGAPPRYAEFRRHWRETATGREFMYVEPQELAVRLPRRAKNRASMLFPQLGEKLLLTEMGGGQQRHVEVLRIVVSESNSVQRLEVAELSP